MFSCWRDETLDWALERFNWRPCNWDYDWLSCALRLDLSLLHPFNEAVKVLTSDFIVERFALQVETWDSKLEDSLCNNWICACIELILLAFCWQALNWEAVWSLSWVSCWSLVSFWEFCCCNWEFWPCNCLICADKFYDEVELDSTLWFKTWIWLL